MIFNEQLSTGECSYSLFLGCRNCDECLVDEYETDLKKMKEEMNNN